MDNSSTDGTVEAVREAYPDVMIIKNEKNLGFAAANNEALRKMSGRYALLLNSDTVLTDGAVRELYDFMEATPDAGMACGQLLNHDGTKQNSIANFPSLLALLTNETVLRILMPNRFPSKRRDYVSPLKVESGVGACLMVRKAAMDDIGLLDERYFFFFEETDWAYRMKRGGWSTYFVPSARIFHAQGKTVGNNVNSRIMYYRSRYLFFRKWQPCFYPIFNTIVFLRLLVNTLLSTAALILTLGCDSSTRKRFIIYVQLIFWHLKGCSEGWK